MNTILLQPTDVLFFRDGRPMSGSLAGHGAAWPLPNVINAAFHAALHRSGLGENAHSHRRGARGIYADDAERDRKFGSLVTAGPFPVKKDKDQSTWLFPRPHDLQDATLQPGLLPTDAFTPGSSSLPCPLKYAVAIRLPPSKVSDAKAWLSRAAFEAYLGTGNDSNPTPELARQTCDDANIFDREHSVGIEIEPATGTTGQGEAEGKIYSAHYLRLHDGWQLGICAAAEDKKFDHAQHGRDLVTALLDGGQHQIIVGGQQRICSATISPEKLPLPHGKRDGFQHRDEKYLVKWVLLSPAIWPLIRPDATRGVDAHSGGWLPNWINPNNGEVLLKGVEVSRHESESREAWRQRTRREKNISAHLVAALIPKPIVVTGWSLPDEGGATEAERNGGAQSAHLAVPAGAVYYFEANGEDEARKLAAALNWHGGDTNPTTIKNRRSTLLGEKGFGLGVCGAWKFLPNVVGRPSR